MNITNKGKTVMLSKTERGSLERAKDLLETLSLLPFRGQGAAESGVLAIEKILKETAPVLADTDSDDEEK